MDAELLENAAVAAKILGISVPRGLLRRAAGALLDAPADAPGGALESAVRDAAAAKRHAQMEARGAQWLAAAAERAEDVGISHVGGAGLDEETGSSRRVQTGGGMGSSRPTESYEMTRESYELPHKTTKTDMAAVSRYFERDARRYGQEG